MNNNPVRYNDPTGHCPTCIVGALVGVVAGAMMVSYRAAITNTELTGKDLLVGALVGGAAGALIGTGVGVGAGTALGATLLGAGIGGASSAAGYTAATVITGEEFNSTEMAANAGIGAISGAISGGAGALAQGGSWAVKTGAAIIQVESAGLAGVAQQMVGDAFDGTGSNQTDNFVAGTTGMSTQIMGGLLDFISPVKGVAGPLLRSAVIETTNNLVTGDATDASYMYPCLCNTACCSTYGE